MIKQIASNTKNLGKSQYPAFSKRIAYKDNPVLQQEKAVEDLHLLPSIFQL